MLFSFAPSLDPRDARQHLYRLIRPQIDPTQFRSGIRRLDNRFAVYAATCPAPLPAPRLIVTPEIRCQCEIYLPVVEIAGCFDRLYCSALTYPPISSSTPFHNALSWADVFTKLSPCFQFSANPARLLEGLIDDRCLLEEFLFASFLPRRFYGGLVRYPGQEAFIREGLTKRYGKPLRCLDAACGTGEGSYGLTRLLLDAGCSPKEFFVEGWTIEPLEVWAAAHASFPHDLRRQEIFRSWAAPVFGLEAQTSMIFSQADLRQPPESRAGFDLITCNGLLGGPIINQLEEMQRIVGNLEGLLRPGGVLLAADNFHGGWKKNIPGETLGDVFKACGLAVREAGEGIGGLKPDQ